MTRGEGFDIADTDTGMLADKKVLALARWLRDATKTGAAIALYDAVRLASWKDGSRLTLEETVPGWWLEPFEELADALVGAELLDAERRIPAHAWDGWFGPAARRRQRYRELGAKGGAAKAEHGLMVKPTLQPTPQPTVSTRSSAGSSVRSTPSVPSVPTEPSVARARAGDEVAEATDGETTGCFRCHGPATETNPLVTALGGRVKHRFNPCPDKAPAADAPPEKPAWLGGEA
jgi:hypothetical protein